jgi:hypothetical protein
MDPTFDSQQIALGGVAGYPYAGLGRGASLGSVFSQALIGPNASTQVGLNTLLDALNNNAGSIDVIAYSGGAQVLATALGELSPADQARIGNILYISPGMVGTLPLGTESTTVVLGTGPSDDAATFGTVIPIADSVSTFNTQCSHTDLACLLSSAGAITALARMRSDGACSSQDIFSRPSPIALQAVNMNWDVALPSPVAPFGLIFGGVDVPISPDGPPSAPPPVFIGFPQ